MTHPQLCLEIAEEIASQEGVTPEALSPPLYEVVDTEALQSLFDPNDPDRCPVSVEFTYEGYTVRIDGANDVTVTPCRSDSVDRDGDGGLPADARSLCRSG
ncbi:HalOD1 output domain-containing protein [Natrarchaeobius halalkaliphilus]|uniref:HalOD1 output domain-containing protein n=1 Tax=Natrarchaeobius halalkaliphilus TaxID=1679091 RepID=UPI001404E79E|nr:HalOD1 output domain-containing protein [Natrarchaeobius halalkaliphilus]